MLRQQHNDQTHNAGQEEEDTPVCTEETGFPSELDPRYWDYSINGHHTTHVLIDPYGLNIPPGADPKAVPPNSGWSALLRQSRLKSDGGGSESLAGESLSDDRHCCNPVREHCARCQVTC